MSDRPVKGSAARGTSKATQALAGVAGALAFLGIGWTMGARTAAQPAPGQTSAQPTTRVPTFPSAPNEGEWGDDGPQSQWGTIQLPSNGSIPAQPGGGLAPPTTGSGGSSVAGASISTSNVTPPSTTATTGGAP